AVDPQRVLLQQVAEHPGEAAEDHEHDREAGDEQGAAGEHAPGGGPGALPPRAGGALAGEPGDVAEVAGHHGQHARGDEGDQSGCRRDGERREQGAGQCRGLEGGSDVVGDHSATTLSIIARSTEGSAAPEIRAATRPSWSMTRVEGTALGATCPRSEYMIS